MSKDSLGVINWWGFTPAIDIFENDLLACNESLTDINILLIGCGDSRHILKTLGSMYCRQPKNINFYIVENGIELYARYMLQMIITLIPLNKIGLQDKTELFLELYGNGLVRQQTMAFVSHLANELIRLVTDLDSCVTTLPFLDLEYLKFKDRDILEAVFKMWKDVNYKTFDMSLCWDLRLRQNLGVRYDAIPNVFDWDCSITLHDKGAEIISSREYGHWRHKGVAFQLRDANYDVSNRTLASGRVLQTANGDKTVRLGYWGDIVCSPYLSFGITSNNRSLFKKLNNQFSKGSSHVSEFNISEIFFQISKKKKFEIDQEISCSSNSRSNVTITEVDSDAEAGSDSDVNPNDIQKSDVLKNITKDLISLPNVKLTFLPINALSDGLVKKTKFQGLFDLIYFSTSLVGQLESCKSLPNLVRDNANVVIELPKFIVSVNSEKSDIYNTRVEEMASVLGMEKCTDPSREELLKYGHVVYKFNK